MNFILVSHLFLFFYPFLVSSDERLAEFFLRPKVVYGDPEFPNLIHFSAPKDEFFTFNLPLPSNNEDLIHPCNSFDQTIALCNHFPKREPLFPLEHVNYIIQFYDFSIFGVPQIYGYARFKENSISYTRYTDSIRVQYSNGTKFPFIGTMGPSNCTPVLSRFHIINLTPTICLGEWQEWGQLYEDCM